MESIPLPTRDDQVPRWAIPAILAFFLVMSLPYGFYALFRKELSFWLPFTLALLTFVVPLLVGLLTRLPRWSLLYSGVVLGGVGVYVIWVILGLLLLHLGLLGTLLADPESLSGRLFYQWIYQGTMWLAIVLAVEVDSTNRVAVQSRVEELLRILHLSTFGECQAHGVLMSTFGECQAHGVLKHISYGYYSVMRPDRDSHWLGGFFPLYFFDHGRVGFLDQSAQL